MAVSFQRFKFCAVFAFRFKWMCFEESTINVTSIAVFHRFDFLSAILLAIGWCAFFRTNGNTKKKKRQCDRHGGRVKRKYAITQVGNRQYLLINKQARRKTEKSVNFLCSSFFQPLASEHDLRLIANTLTLIVAILKLSTFAKLWATTKKNWRKSSWRYMNGYQSCTIIITSRIIFHLSLDKRDNLHTHTNLSHHRDNKCNQNEHFEGREKKICTHDEWNSRILMSARSVFIQLKLHGLLASFCKSLCNPW